MSTVFYKAHGAGNDFILFLDRKGLTPEHVKALCHRRTGIGADGVVNIFEISQGLLGWEFYNSDGSTAEMCGNAARCVVRIAEAVFGYTEIDLKTEAGIVHGKSGADQVEVSLAVAVDEPKKISAPLGGRFPEGFLVDTGVPHFVVPVKDPFALKSEEKTLAAFLRDPAFGPRGANLTFADVASDPVRTVSLERGVEEFTLACGTGVIATAKVAQWLNPTNTRTRLQTPGGFFTVEFQTNTAILSGPAEIVFKGEI